MPSPKFSIINEKPGPEVQLMLLWPPREAPKIAAILASSSSIWTKTPPTRGNRCETLSAISVDGVIG
jgi:hypothetical protein